MTTACRTCGTPFRYVQVTKPRRFCDTCRAAGSYDPRSPDAPPGALERLEREGVQVWLDEQIGVMK